METKNYTLDASTTVGCGCAGCQSQAANPDIDQGSGGTSGETSAPNGQADPNVFANYLTDGYWQDQGYSSFSWAQNTVSYSITGYTASQKSGLKTALDLWADVADIDFVEVSSNADLSIITNTEKRAYSSSSYNGNQEITNSTITIDPTVNSFSNIGTIGNYAFMTALHEIGHSLGLGHTGNYNGAASYGVNAQWTNDTHQTTVMSYFNDSNVGSDHIGSTGGWKYSATPMLIDILAVQNIYGADYDTRSGDTIYGFNSNAGDDQYDFSIMEVPIAIWDGNGTDTIDLSGYSTNQRLYLTQGDYSSVGHMTNNLVIAYGADIENAIGGAGNDTFYANDLNNNIDGNDGNDVINYIYNVTQFAFNFISNSVVALTHISKNFTDTISNIENFIFADSSYSFEELKTAFNGSNTIAFRFFWNSGEYAYNSIEDENLGINANEMGYNNTTENQVSIVRDSNNTTVTINNPNAPNILRIHGSDFNDTLKINGTHNNLSARLYGGNGHDAISIAVTGNHRLYGEEGNDTLAGYSGNDIIFGGQGTDILYGGSGNDYLYGENNSDELNGGNGSDKLYGGSGNDVLNGEMGNDNLIGGTGDDTLNGGDGNDRLDANEGNDTLNGGAGTDKLYGYSGTDTLNGGDDNDRLYGMDDNDILNGDAGHDLLIGGAGDDTLNGGDGNDRLKGEEGNDLLNGGDGKDKLYGEDGDDELRGGQQQDKLYGGTGHDNLYGDDGNDVLYGQEGNDTLDGGLGHDFLNGGEGDDTINGGDGIDRLYGENGDDHLYAGDGDDELHGGIGNDTIVGGNGLNLLFGEDGGDTFGLIALDNQVDQIRDFTLTGTDNDNINITDLLSGYNTATDDINDFVALSVKSSDRTDLYINTDGEGTDWVKAAIIRGSDLTGVSADDLLTSNQLITDTTLL